MTNKVTLLSCFLTVAIGLNFSCSKKSDDEDKSENTPVGEGGTADGTPNEYADQKKWLCLPNRLDSCAEEPSTNELLADGTFQAVGPNPTPDETVDCFYVHPTSDLSVKAGNSNNFEYLEPDERLAQMQIAPFHGSCRIFAPLYHQVTIGTYALPKVEQEPFLKVAETDVINAFDYYMANYNAGRKIVLIGHSQGSELLSRLLLARFDLVPEMRAKLILAILPGYAMRIPIGSFVGGTFANIPACSTAGEVGCVISYRAYKAGTKYLGDADISLLELEEELCVNPATLDDATLSIEDRRKARVPLAGTLLPPPDWISNSVRNVQSSTPFVLANAAYSAACDSGPDPRSRFLSIDENLPLADPRHSLVLLDSEPLTGLTGLHTLDMQFPMAELVKLVRARR